jgi:membrane protein DedA with SNARE-associated domain
VDKAHEWFERRGDATVFSSRLLPVIRTFISLPAGVARMPIARFSVYTLLGVIPWTFGLAWLGARLGARWEVVTEWLRPVAWLIVAALLIGAVVYVARRWRQVRAEYAALDAAAGREAVAGTARGAEDT